MAYFLCSSTTGWLWTVVGLCTLRWLRSQAHCEPSPVRVWAFKVEWERASYVFLDPLKLRLFFCVSHYDQGWCGLADPGPAEVKSSR